MNTQHDWWTRAAAVLVVVAAPALTGCDKPPPPKPPTPVTTMNAAGSASPIAAPADAAKPTPKDVGTFKVSGAEDDPTTIQVAGLTMSKPVTWVWTTPSQSMRALQYAVPAEGGTAGAAELTFTVFTGTDGGPIASNLDRWAAFFRNEDGSQAPHTRSEMEAGGKKIYRQDSQGSYAGMMGQAAPRPGYAQLGAIIDAGDQRVFIKLVGPTQTVESNRTAFDAMLKSVK